MQLYYVYFYYIVILIKICGPHNAPQGMNTY